MNNQHELTDIEVENFYTEALGELADAVREYEVAKQKYRQQKPTPELATRRITIARDAIRQSLTVYDNLKRQRDERLAR